MTTLGILTLLPLGWAEPTPGPSPTGQEPNRPAEGVSEVFLANTMGGDYAKMKSEIMIPIRKATPAP